MGKFTRQQELAWCAGYSADGQHRPTTTVEIQGLQQQQVEDPKSADICVPSGAPDLFHWLGWSPAPASASSQTLRDCFPQALPAQAVVNRLVVGLQAKGISPANTLVGSTICPDEINMVPGSLVHSLEQAWGAVCPLGGLGGAPHAGKTGFRMFLRQKPKDGYCIIVFGPHVGISESGELGKCAHPGQTKETPTCEWVMNAYDRWKDKLAAEFDETDMQQSWLNDKISRRGMNLMSGEDPVNDLVWEAYDIILESLSGMIGSEFDGSLVLLGGILINLKRPVEDHFQPMMFERRLATGQTEDLMQAFGA